ncbi:hypothetical protein VNI00_001992 [Paramarasmius palmivorus]|uniref:SH3 domain-containing protein n=1 Tax=Paramarasmius palmivorus TaxID=297713 RepID=A0AAW0E0Q0_9AGAR
MPKINTPLPQPLPKECEKAAKICQYVPFHPMIHLADPTFTIVRSFVDRGNNGLDGVVPREVIENAKGFAIFTVFKAGFVFSARAGSGIVIARLPDGSWSAPSAIGTAGLGFGGQAGAEMTDFLVVLNSRSALRSFMAAGSLTLGGNASIAVGPLGRNGEATGALNTNGKLAAMYSYSKTRGLFGGISIEGSVLVERQDANVQAYHDDSISVKKLLSGAIEPPEWASSLIRTLESCTGMPGSRKWVDDRTGSETSYAFDGLGSPGSVAPSRKLKKGEKSPFPPPSWGTPKENGGYFDHPASTQVQDDSWQKGDPTATSSFGTRFESDFTPSEELRKHKRLSYSYSHPSSESFDGFSSGSTNTHNRSMSMANPSSISRSSTTSNPFDDLDHDFTATTQRSATPHITPKPELMKPLAAHEGVGRAIALYDFKGVEPGDLSFNKGDVITITEKSDSIDDWWTGKVGAAKGIFPANFVEVV